MCYVLLNLRKIAYVFTKYRLGKFQNEQLRFCIQNQYCFRFIHASGTFLPTEMAVFFSAACSHFELKWLQHYKKQS